MDGDAYLEFAAGRRSTRIYKPDPVSPEKIERLIEAATYAPTACNRQLWHFVVVTGDEMKVRISKLSAAQQSYIYDAPALICVFYDCTLENRNPCKTPFIGAGMSIYAILLAAEAEELGAIYLGGIRRPDGIAKAVGAPRYLTCLGVIAVGYRADTPPTPNRRKATEIISYERCTLPEKHYHADIRPHLWNLRQLADFRDKLLWYKGVHIDGLTLHVDPDSRFSNKYHYLTGRLGMIIQQFDKPRVLDVFAQNGDIVFQLMNACGSDIETLYAYDLTPGILKYMKVRFEELCDTPNLEYILNANPDNISIPLPDDHVDVLSCYERLEHFENPEPLLQEMRRILKPGGRALVVVSNRFYPHMYRYKRMRKKNYALGRNWNRGPERKFEARQAEDYMRRAGFVIESMTGLQPVQMKAAALAEGVCRKLKQFDWADAWADRRRELYRCRSYMRKYCSSMAYEITKR